MAAKRPTFFMRRSDRLVARLRHLFFCVRFAKQVDGLTIMCWTPLSEFSQTFDSEDYFVDRIFDLREFYANGGANDLIFYHCVAQFPPDLRSLSSAEFDGLHPDKYPREVLSQPGTVIFDGKYVNLQFADENKSLDQLAEEVRDIFYSMPLERLTQRTLDVAREKIKSEKYVVLHVRRGDVSGMLLRDMPKLAERNLDPRQLKLTIGHYLGRTAPFAFYYSDIQAAIASGAKILFSSDSPETFDHFASRFGPKNFLNVNDFVKTRYPIQKAFVDFSLFAGADKIISTASTYAAFASQLGKIELRNVGRGGAPEEWEQALIDDYAPYLVRDKEARSMILKQISEIRRRPVREEDAA